MTYISARGLITLLSDLPEKQKDLPVVINRGEWGPCPLLNGQDGPRIMVVRRKAEPLSWWEVVFPEVPDDPDDDPRQTVVVL